MKHSTIALLIFSACVAITIAFVMYGNNRYKSGYNEALRYDVKKVWIYDPAKGEVIDSVMLVESSGYQCFDME